MTRRALVAYSIGLLGLILVKVLAPGFYARQNIRTPVKIAVITLVATQLMNLVLIGPLKHAGLALAIGLGACLNAGLLYYKLRQHRIYQPQPAWAQFSYKLATGAADDGCRIVGSDGQRELVAGRGLAATRRRPAWYSVPGRRRILCYAVAARLSRQGFFAACRRIEQKGVSPHFEQTETL